MPAVQLISWKRDYVPNTCHMLKDHPKFSLISQMMKTENQKEEQIQVKKKAE